LETIAHKHNIVLILGITLVVFACRGQKLASPVQKEKKTEELSYALYIDAEQQYALEKNNSSRSIYRKIAMAHKDSSGPWARIACTYANEGMHVSALKTLDTALRLEPKNYDYLSLKAKWLQDSRQYSEASKAYLKLGEINQKSWSSMEDAAQMASKARDYSALKDICDKWKTRFELNDRIGLYYLSAFDNLRDTSGIFKIFDELESKYPERLKYKKQRLNYLTQRGYYDLAFNNGLETYNSFKQDDEVVYNYLTAALKLENWTRASLILKNLEIDTIGTNATLRIAQLAYKHLSNLPDLNDILAKYNKRLMGDANWSLWYGAINGGNINFEVVKQNLNSEIQNDPNNLANWEKLLSLMYFTERDHNELKEKSTEFSDYFPLMNLGPFYLYCAGGVGADFILNDIYSQSVEAHKIWSAGKPLQALDILRKGWEDIKNPVILYWMYEMATELGLNSEAKLYKAAAKEYGAIIETK
jgi:tetratricopeptide (TPR) repeat protein